MHDTFYCQNCIQYSFVFFLSYVNDQSVFMVVNSLYSVKNVSIFGWFISLTESFVCEWREFFTMIFFNFQFMHLEIMLQTNFTTKNIFSQKASIVIMNIEFMVVLKYFILLCRVFLYFFLAYYKNFFHPLLNIYYISI